MIPKRTNVYLYGINTINLGDDLFIKVILERYPNTQFILRAPHKYKSIFSKYANCKVISETDIIIRYLIIILRCCKLPYSKVLDLLILLRYRIKIFLIIGGSIFMEGNSNIPSLLKKLKKLRKIIPKLKILVLGSNYGPEKTDEWFFSVKESIEGIDDICFRDKASFTKFQNLPNVRYGNDIVMHSKYELKNLKQKSICINLRSVDKWNSLKPHKDKYLSKTKEIIEYFQEKGYSINLISFCQKYGDDEIINELYSSLNLKTDVHKYYYRGDFEECINLIKSSEYILATRFHAIILGLALKLKVIPISYSNKGEETLKSLKIWNKIYDFKTFCESPLQVIISSSINEFDIDLDNNRQFDILDLFLKQ